MNQLSKSKLGLWLAIGAISTAAIFIRFAQRSLPSLTIAAYRLLLASMVLLPFYLSKNLHEDRKRINGKIGAPIVLSGIFLALHFYSWVSSLEFTNVTSSVVLVTTTPIWVAIISLLVLKETIRRGFWFGLLIAMVGTIVITGFFSGDFGSTASQNQVIKGNALALFGAWCAAGYVVIGKKIRQVLSTGSYIFLVYSCCGLILVMFACLSGQPLVVHSSKDWFWLVLLALIPQLIGHSLINWSLGFIPASKVSVALLGEPVGASLLAVLFLGEIPAIKEIAGGLLILGGIYIAMKSDSGSV